MTKACVVVACEAASKSVPDAPVEAATCLMARRATMSFQALSLKAPKNCAMSNPRRAEDWDVSGEKDGGVSSEIELMTFGFFSVLRVHCCPEDIEKSS
jgi:hypothetical protein